MFRRIMGFFYELFCLARFPNILCFAESSIHFNLTEEEKGSFISIWLLKFLFRESVQLWFSKLSKSLLEVKSLTEVKALLKVKTLLKVKSLSEVKALFKTKALLKAKALLKVKAPACKYIQVKYIGIED